MKVLGWIVFVVVQIVFIPLLIVGLVIMSWRQIAVSKQLGVSATATSVIGNRWVMDLFGVRRDEATVRLYRALPNGSPLGLWLLCFPGYLRYRISGVPLGLATPDPEGHERVAKLGIDRTMLFDKLIERAEGTYDQFVMLGAGLDTRCYGPLLGAGTARYELDQASTQKLKIECLKKTGMDASHVRFVDVDFTKERWYEKLAQAGYDPAKRTLFLWEGVTPYLAEADVLNTLKEIRSHAAPDSAVLMDLYSTRLMSLRGVKSTGEGFRFGLDFGGDPERALHSFFSHTGVSMDEVRWMGYRTQKGAFGAVVRIALR